MTSREAREEAIKRVSQCILQDRNAAYGDPEDNFRNIVELWRAAGFGCDIHDVSLLMMQVKVARIKNNPSHLDSWIDIAGYALCQAGMIIKEQASKQTESGLLSNDAPVQSEHISEECEQLVQGLESQLRTDKTGGI